MATFKAKIEIKFKPGVLDPQGVTIKNSLGNMGFSGIQSVSTGKMFVVTLEADSAQKAKNTAAELADKLLANPVIENFSVEVDG
jgi:phosphoribosylformylglycinamidine synthase PurS subunit